jgi:hypothetical protein
MPGKSTKASAYEVAQGIDLETEQSAIRGLPSVVPNRQRNRPKDWAAWNEAQRLEYTFGCSLDNLEILLSWEPTQLDDTRFRAWKEATLSVVNIGARYGLQRARIQGDEYLATVRKRLAARDSNAD